MPGEWGHSLSLQDAQDLRDTPVQLIVRGDASVTCIAAASVLATVRVCQISEQPQAACAHLTTENYKSCFSSPVAGVAAEQDGTLPA